MAWTPTDPTPAVLTASQADTQGGTAHRSGATLPMRRLSEFSSPLTRHQFDVQQAHLLDDLAYVYMLQLATVHVSGLNVGVFAGVYRKSDGTMVTFGGQKTFALDDDTTDQYVYILHSTGALTKGTSLPGDGSTYTPLAMVDTANGSVVADTIRDLRQAQALQAHATTSAPTGTTATSFLMDNDNSGAGVDCYYAAERGSDDAEDAALAWRAATARWETLSQMTSGTLCPLNCTQVLISGTAMLTSDGAAKVASGVAGAGLQHAAGVLTPDVDDSTVEVDGSDQIAVKDGGVGTSKLSDTLADKLVQISIGDASGSSPQTVTIQALDIQGNSLAEAVYVQIGVYDDADGATEATNATIADGGSGSLVRWEATDKVGVFKTDSTGGLQIQVTDGTAETVYLIAAATTRSRMLDCADIGTVAIS